MIRYLGTFTRWTSQFYTLGPVLDQNGTPFKPAVAQLTLYDTRTLTVLNNRDHFDVIGRWGADGIFTFEFSRQDMEMINPALSIERRRCLIEWWYGAVNERKGEHEFVFGVENAPKIIMTPA